jgi:membrane dipeptidase
MTLTRRTFGKGLAAVGALSFVRPFELFAVDPGAASAGATASVSREAAELYRRAFVLDCNTLAGLNYADFKKSPEDQAKLRSSGVNVIKATLGGATGNFEDAVKEIAAADELMEKGPDFFLKVRGIGDLDRAKPENKMGVIYSFEAASMLEDKIERIEIFRNLGVRVMQLSYNHKSPFAVGCLDGETPGLTDLGRQAVAKMNEISVALDLSHSNTQSTADGIAVSKKPPIISHAGCRAVHMHPRNKEDREMKALADKGGVMGIYMLPYLTESPKQPTLDDYMAHMKHAIKVMGEDHVGIGSDVPFFAVTQKDLDDMKKDEEERKKTGVAAPGEDRPPYIPDLNSERKMERIADALLKRGYKSGAVEKILGANFKRVFTEVWS